jgi:hypothetical protein
LQALDDSIDVAEASAAADKSARVVASRVARAADNAAARDDDAEPPADAAADAAAYAAATAATATNWATINIAAKAANVDNAHAAITAAAYAAATVAAKISKHIWQDFEIVQSIIVRESWTDVTPVPPSVFGPMWPDGPPPDWPPLPQPKRLKLTVRVPDGVRLNKDALPRVARLAALLAELDVAGGGHGLKFEPPLYAAGVPARTKVRT